MKKKNVAFAVYITAILSVGAFLSIEYVLHSGNEYSYLMLQNIEALSQIEGGYDSSDCKDGFPQYTHVYDQAGRCEVIQHFCDGSNGNYGTDQYFTIDYKGCSAYGTGSLPGHNYVAPIGQSNIEYIPCRGAKEHRNSPF